MAAILVKYHYNTDFGDFATIGCKKTLGDGCLIVSLGTQNKAYVMANFDTFVRNVCIRLDTPYLKLNYYLNGKRSTYKKVTEDLRRTADYFYKHNLYNK